MNTYVLWFLLLLPLPIAITVFSLSSRKSLLRGYLFGLIPIFLFWQIVSVLTLPSEIDSIDNHRGEGLALFVLLFYWYLFLAWIYYTGLSLSLGWAYRRVVRLTHIRGRVKRVLVASALVVFLGISWAIIIPGTFLFMQVINSQIGGAPGRDFFAQSLMIFWGLHSLIVKYGMLFFILLDGILLCLALIWFLVRQAWKRRPRLAQG